MFKIKNVELKNNVILAPMAGVCNEAFRVMCHNHNAGLVCAEMVSDKALFYNNQKTLDMLKTNEFEHPLSMQVFGSDVETIVNAAKIIDKYCDAEIIDINMGCPVNKVAKKANAGSALLKDPKKVYEIVKSVVENVKKPVTVKIRSGWDDEHINAVEIAKLIEKAGASAITVHPRTRAQMYNGHSNWDIIRQVKESVNIPVIGNGDIKSCYDAKKMLEETKCDAIMIGRGALGNPWIFDEITEYLKTGIVLPKPSFEEIHKTILNHARLLIEIKNEHVAILEMRSHVAWYIKGLPNSTFFKNELFKCTTLNGLKDLLNQYFSHIIELRDKKKDEL